MFKNKELKYVENAFKIERYCYERTVKSLHEKVCRLERELESAYNTTIEDLTSETIKQLEVEKGNLQVQNEQLKIENEKLRAQNDLMGIENDRLTKELDQCSKKLNATQYKEYKRLKQAEYQRRWLKKKQAQAKK